MTSSRVAVCLPVCRATVCLLFVKADAGLTSRHVLAVTSEPSTIIIKLPMQRLARHVSVIRMTNRRRDSVIVLFESFINV